MMCKKIKNDEGYWEVLERYISDHSAADFSHGICPSCAPGYRESLKQEAGAYRTNNRSAPGNT